MSLYSDALESVFDSIEDVAGEDLEYITAGVTVEVSGVAGQDQASEPNRGGRTMITQRTLDFMIHKDKMVHNDQPVVPRRGDIIRRANTGSRYKVLAPNGGPVWRWSDSNEIYYRIQTIRIGD